MDLALLQIFRFFFSSEAVILRLTCTQPSGQAFLLWKILRFNCSLAPVFSYLYKTSPERNVFPMSLLQISVICHLICVAAVSQWITEQLNDPDMILTPTLDTDNFPLFVESLLFYFSVQLNHSSCFPLFSPSSLFFVCFQILVQCLLPLHLFSSACI